jgi:AraC-like DNA-binding protein
MSGTVSSVVIRLILAGARRAGADSRLLAQEADLADWALENDGIRFPVAQLERLWQVAMTRLEDPRLGLDVAAAWRFGALGLMDYLFATAPTLAEACRTAFTYLPLLNSPGLNEVALTTWGAVRCHIHSPDVEVSRMATECSFSLLVHCARHATGRQLAPARVQFAGPAPRSHRYLTESFGTPLVDFGADVPAMTFRQADLALPLLRADPILARILRGAADEVMVAPEQVPRWVDRFREVLAECVDNQTVHLGIAARRLHISPRTLQRFLEQEGTTWRAEVEAVRRERAARLLSTGHSRAQVAAQLGYADARALRRATRRWERDCGTVQRPSASRSRGNALLSGSSQGSLPLGRMTDARTRYRCGHGAFCPPNGAASPTTLGDAWPHWTGQRDQ